MRLLKQSVAFRNSIVRLRTFAFISNVKFLEPNSKTIKFFKYWFIVYVYCLRGLISGQCIVYGARESDL